MISSPNRFETYLFRYEHNGATWGFEIQAASPEDAKARLTKIAGASYDGVLMASIPVPSCGSGLLARLLRLIT